MGSEICGGKFFSAKLIKFAMETMRNFLNAAVVAVAFGFAAPAQAETWWLVVVADSRGPSNGPLFWPIALESKQDCEANGAELMTSSKDGIFDQANIAPFGFKCFQEE